MAIIRVSNAMIKAARAEFERRCQDPEDEHATVEDVVVACGVTREDLEQANSTTNNTWYDVRLALLPDSTLIVDRLMFDDPVGTLGPAYTQIWKYALSRQEQAFAMDQEIELNYKAFGLRMHDVVLFHAEKPLVVLEVLLDGASIVRTLKMATGYLQNSDSLERIVIFHCFPATMNDGLWKGAALAMVFGLADPSNRASRVQLLEVQSFGNVGVDADVVDALVAGLAVPEVEPLSRERGQLLLQPGLQCEIRDTDVYGDGSDWVARRGRKLCIPMGSFDDLVVDVVPVMLAAMHIVNQRHYGDAPASDEPLVLDRD